MPLLRRARTASVLLASTLAVALAACTSITAEGAEACDELPTLSAVGALPSPRLEWTPGCAVYRLEISDSITGQIQWTVQTLTPERRTIFNGVLPGINYGLPPLDADPAPALPLTAGRAYAVQFSVARAESRSEVLGRAYFRP
jgi:hypothetical protein